MPTVIHIDRSGGFQADYGENAEKVAQMLVKPGDSIYDVMKCLGYSVAKMEKVPAPPRKLSPDVAEFIASYEYEDPPAVLAVVRRYGWLDAEEFDTAEEAKGFIESGEDWGSLAGEAIVDGDEIRVWD